nr:hypothetical protein CFP56_50288 [Quercus suber]
MHEDRDCNLWLSNRNKASMEKGQFGPWIRAEINFASRKPKSSASVPKCGDGSLTLQTKTLLVSKSPTGHLSGMVVEVAKADSTHPNKVSSVVASVSNVHAKSLLGNPKSFERMLQLIDSELGLDADLVVPPCVDLSNVVINAKSNPPPKKLPAGEGPKTRTSVSLPLVGDIGPQEENGMRHTFAFSASCTRPSFQAISNVNGPMNKSKATTQGKWTRIDRQPTNNPSDENMGDLNKVRPALEDLKP